MSEEMSEEKSEVGLKYKKESLSVHARGLPIVNVWSWLGFPHVPDDPTASIQALFHTLQFQASSASSSEEESVETGSSTESFQEEI
jgi:hypothetical protein